MHERNFGMSDELPEAGFYRDWMDDRATAIRRLPANKLLSASDLADIEAWNQRVAVIGLTAIVTSTPKGTHVIEIQGVDGAEDVLPPSWIIYPVGDDGFILEEFSGQRQQAYVVAHALALVSR